MNLQDPIADMLTRIRNALYVRKPQVLIYFSKQKKKIADLLLKEGYIQSVNINNDEKNLNIGLKYHQGLPVIKLMKRVSKPSLRIYKKSSELPKVNAGFGIALISTSLGIMSDRQAREKGLGGEVICFIA